MQKSPFVDEINVDGSLKLTVVKMDHLMVIHEVIDGENIEIKIDSDFNNDRWEFVNGKLKSKCRNVNADIHISDIIENIHVSCDVLHDTIGKVSLVNAESVRSCEFTNTNIIVNSGSIENCKFHNIEVRINGNIVNCDLINCSGSINGNMRATKLEKCHDFVFNGAYDDSVEFKDCERFYFCGLKRD